MPKPVFRRLTNGELKLDYTEAARNLKLSRADTKKDAAQEQNLCRFNRFGKAHVTQCNSELKIVNDPKAIAHVRFRHATD